MDSMILERDSQAFLSKTNLKTENSPGRLDASNIKDFTISAQEKEEALLKYTQLMEQMMSKLSENKQLMSQLLTNINQIKVISAKLDRPDFNSVCEKRDTAPESFLLAQFETQKRLKAYQTETNNYSHAIKYAAIEKENALKKLTKSLPK